MKGHKCDVVRDKALEAFNNVGGEKEKKVTFCVTVEVFSTKTGWFTVRLGGMFRLKGSQKIKCFYFKCSNP